VKDRHLSLTTLWAAVVPALLVVSGCNLLGPQRIIEVKLPSQPPRWPVSVEPERHRIIWRDGNGTLRTLTKDGNTRRVVIRIPKRPGTAVLVETSYRGGAFTLRPAAAVYPHDTDEAGRLEASHERGFTGLVLHRVGFSLPSFNAGRLIEEVQSRSDGNPWLFDTERVVSKIAAGEFSTIYLRPREVHPVSVEVPVGRYVSGNPLLPPIDVEAASDPTRRAARPARTGRSAETGVLSISLPVGVHRFARVGPAGRAGRRDTGAGDEVIISISVDETGSCRVFRR
jgi:hypothetical protein